MAPSWPECPCTCNSSMLFRIDDPSQQLGAAVTAQQAAQLNADAAEAQRKTFDDVLGLASLLSIVLNLTR